MKTRLCVALALGLACSPLLAAEDAPAAETAPAQEAAAPAAAKANDPGTVLFSINGTDVTSAMLQQLVEERIQPGIPITTGVQQQLITQMANLILLSQAALADKLDQDPSNKGAIEMARISSLASLSLHKVLSESEPEEAELKNIYDKEYNKPRLEYKARHILVRDEAEAKAIIEELKGGKDFIELAKEKSIDPSAQAGGDLNWFSLGAMVAPFSDAVAKMSKGDVSAEPVQSKFGWHIIRLDDQRALPAIPFEDLKPQITEEWRQQLVQNYLKSLHDKAEIKPGVIAEKPAESPATEAEAPAAPEAK